MIECDRSVRPVRSAVVHEDDRSADEDVVVVVRVDVDVVDRLGLVETTVFDLYGIQCDGTCLGDKVVAPAEEFCVYPP